MRAIDGDWLYEKVEARYRVTAGIEHRCERDFLDLICSAPTLTPPNEPLTLINMSDELPPDNERVLVYRPCMEDSDIGPYSVQWGWAAKRDGGHWAHLPGRRPPEESR